MITLTPLTLGTSLLTLLAVAKAQVAESDFFACNFFYKKRYQTDIASQHFS
jgi:hypothetical protein